MDRDRRYYPALAVFVVLALGLALLHPLLLSPIFVAAFGFTPDPELLNVMRSFGPALAAVLAAAYLGGGSELRGLWQRLTRWRVDGLIYVLALMAPIVMMAVAIVTTLVFQPEVVADPAVQWPRLILIFAILPFLDGPLGEELGWRGFLVPLLRERHGAWPASMLTGLVWFTWHLPLYQTDGRDLGSVFLAKYLVYILALSFIHTWLLQRSRQSLVISILFHNMTNYVVLVGFTVFPALQHIALDNNLYLVAMTLAGCAAAAKLWYARPILPSPASAPVPSHR